MASSRLPDASRSGVPDTMTSLGLSPCRLWALATISGLPPALVCWLCGGTGAACAMVGLAVVALAAVAVHRTLALLSGRVVKPLKQSLDALEHLRRGEGSYRLRESGAPIVQRLVERLNAASSAVDQRSRISQASRVSAEQAFERIHAVLQSLVEGVILIDDDQRVVLANPCARRLLDGGDRPIEGRPVLPMLTSGLREHIESGLAGLGGGRDQVQIMGLQTRDRVYDVSIVRAQSLRLGGDFGSVIALVDVTRNHEIARLKDEFLSSISHELRTPLTNICAFTEILGQVTPNGGSDWEEFLSIVSSESHRLKGLVEDILEHSRLHTGQVDWRQEPIDMAEMVELAVELFSEQAERQHIELSWSHSGEGLTARGDRQRLHEVLARLLDNALKFTPDGGRVVVQVTDRDSAVEVSVDDSGVGVEAEHRETVFERFRQIGDQLTEKPRGAGLGLPICRGFIDGMGGAIWCEESELGGAKFRFVLPADSEEALEKES